MGKKIIITQSNYIPWKGYFDSIKLVDEVILYDDMQYTKRDWRNRNKIKTPKGPEWMSIPVEVKGKYFQAIKDTKVSDSNWNKKHWDLIKENYSKADSFLDNKEFFENLYLNCNEDYLSLINYRFLRAISDYLGINTPIIFSMDFDLIEGKTERLIDLCKKVGGTDYYTGPAAKNYMDEDLFAQENINVHYLDYSCYPVYKQLNGDFTHEVSIIDLILNEGENASLYMKNFK
jgi:hypothetical protein